MSMFLLGLLIAGLLIAAVSWMLSLATRFYAMRTHVLAIPSGRRRHKIPTPQLGGLGIGITLLLFLGGMIALRLGMHADRSIAIQQLVGFSVGVLGLLVMGVLDDLYDLPAPIRFFWYALVSLFVVLSGTTIHAVTCLNGEACSLIWWQSQVVQLGAWRIQLSLPGDILAWAWLFTVTFTTKLLDGLDGLVTGQTMIGIVIMLLLSLTPAFFHFPVVLLAMIMLGSFAGFLPMNFPPAKQYLGESGSVLAGFSIAFLSLVSGAKMAMAFLALGLPLIDMLIVVFERVRAGRAPWIGDRTHLHFRLQDAGGLSALQSLCLLWGISALFGIAALLVKTPGKIVLAIGVVAVTIGLRAWCASRKKV